MSERLGVLDGLRGIAVFLVLWYHVWEISWLPAPLSWMQFIPETGFVGVHLFFFLSGFVIAYPFVRAAAAAVPEPSWKHFAWRRFIKIMPSYLLSIIVAYAIGYAATVRFASTPWQEILTHMLFIHTWWLGTYGSINGVLWTLAIEVEFYLVFPLVWWCFKRWPWLTALAMVMISLAWRMWAARCCLTTSFPLLSENLPGYLDIFAFGMLSAWIFVRANARIRGSRLRVTMPLVASLGMALLVMLLLNIYAQRTVQNWEVVAQIYIRALYGLAFAIIALGSLFAPRAWQLVLSNPPLRFLAIVSYNLYLYNQIVARELVAWHLPPYHGDPHADSAWQVSYTVIAFIATIAFATIVTYAVERPLLRARQPRLLIAATGHSTPM